MKTELTEQEQQYADEKDSLMHETIKHCSILYAMSGKPCSETCMCWLWSCGYGWFDILEKLSTKLEAINLMIYPKYKVRIQAEQVKEKFSTLRFYYSIIADPPWYIRWYEAVMEFAMFKLLQKLDFKPMRIVEQDGYESIDKKFFYSREEYEAEKNKFSNASNVSFEELDNKFVMITKVWHPAKYKTIVKSNKLFYWFYTKRYAFKNWLRYILKWESSTQQNIIINNLYDIVDKFVQDAEIECSNYCETCGHRINTKYSPTCTTRGWIKQICKECADKIGYEYVSEGKIWKSGEIIGEAKKFNNEDNDDEV